MSKIIFSELEQIQEILGEIRYSKLFVLVDEETEKHCYPLLKPLLKAHKVITVPHGEVNKTLASCSKIWQALTENEADRNALLINLGGGVITDMGGFCAGTYKRGINFINIPTTLLAQVDASVGGKTGVDFASFKNHIGLFCVPRYVLVDTVFHQTLADKQLRSGFAEMLKHGVISDMSHWKALKQVGYANIELSLIKDSVGIKQRIVEADPTEKGLRKILNFGHTIGHAIESFCLSNGIALLHGEAVAIGMIAETYISRKKEMISEELYTEIVNYLTSVYQLPEIKKTSYAEIVRLCKQDKKNKDGAIFMSLLENRGQATFDIAVEDSLIDEALHYTLGPFT